MQFYPFLVPTLYDLSHFFDQQPDDSVYPPTLSLTSFSLAGNKVCLLDAEENCFIWLPTSMHDILIDALLGDDWKEREQASDFYHTVEVTRLNPRSPYSSGRRLSPRSCLPSLLDSTATSCSPSHLCVWCCRGRLKTKRRCRLD